VADELQNHPEPGSETPEKMDGNVSATSEGTPDQLVKKSPGFFRNLWRLWLFPLLVIVLVVTSFRSVVIDWNLVPSGSMKPTILIGDRILVNKLAYDLKFPFTTWHLMEWGDPARGDIVVFFSPKDGRRMVKRVVGLPGEEITLLGNQVSVNGRLVDYEPLDESIVEQMSTKEQLDFKYLNEIIDGTAHPVMIVSENTDRGNVGSVQIPPGHYFVLGDHRDNSSDSRAGSPVWGFGFLPRQNIIGRASRVVLSLDRDHWYKPRGGRFWYKLP